MTNVCRQIYCIVCLILSLSHMAGGMLHGLPVLRGGESHHRGAIVMSHEIASGVVVK
jgi:hypothetical protein